jgi:mono/diheme cytochrome c family protein
VLNPLKSKLDLFVAALLVAAPVARGALTPDQVKALPPPASHPIDFKTEIQPIFEASCIRCHGRGRARGGLRIDTRETLLRGGDSGPAAIPGQSAQSYLIALVAGCDPDEVMPKKGTKLTAQQIGALRAWIDQGLSWAPEIGFGPVPPKNLEPRLPAIPVTDHSSHPLDRFMDVYFQEHHIQAPPVVNDRLFARRVYLDTIGLLPPARELEAFVSSGKADKRAALVKDLLSRREAYAQNWMSFWNDLLRNDYKGTGYIDGGREQITRWLYSALLTNMPYDQLVAGLVNPDNEAAGFTKGIVWRGVVNASQRPEMQAAQNIAQVFMGVNLKCASCHDSFINDWQLSDAYGLASVFSDQPLELFRCDLPTGQKAAAKFIFPQLGDIPATTNKAQRLHALARALTGPRDGRLTRTIVNRLWAKFLGRGLVEPVDDMQQTAWDQDLLDWLAEDLAAHQFDLKQTMERILTSRAYQLPAADPGGQADVNYIFTGPGTRRLTAEEFRDALASLTGVGYSRQEADVEAEEAVKKLYAPKRRARWIWNDPMAAQKALAGAVYLRKRVYFLNIPDEAQALVTCDNSFTLYVNGHKAAAGRDFTKPVMTNLRPWLRRGANVVAVEAVNYLPDGSAPTPEKAVPGTENPAGFYLYARVRSKGLLKEQVLDFVSDASWAVTDQKADGWEESDFDSSHWAAASELGDFGITPWKLRGDLMAERFGALHQKMVRASLVGADPLQRALGRPNREQVATTRPTAATTLQALELTNGKTLADLLTKGAADLAKQSPSGRKLARRIFEQAVGRQPTPAELNLAEGLLGKRPEQTGVEDFLWAMAMLPEFQLIY